MQTGFEQPLLKMDRISVRDSLSHQPILDDFGLEVSAGEIVCLEGPSGVGKTVAAMTAAGLLPEQLEQTGGTVQWKGKDRSLRPKIPAQDGLVFLFQDVGPSFNPLLPVGPQVADPLRAAAREMPEKEYRQRTLEALRFVGLQDVERIYDSRPNQLSGGQLQRCAIASAALVRADLIIADEPTASLDFGSRRTVLDLFRKLHGEHQTAILIITHHRHLADDLGARRACVQSPKTDFTSEPTLNTEKRSVAAPADSSAAPILEVKALNKSFPCGSSNRTRFRVLEDLSFIVRSGEIVGIAGPSGSGKTTLAKCLMHLCEYEGGEIRLNGTPLSKRTRPQDCAHSGLRMIWQDPYVSVNPLMRVETLVKEALRTANFSTSAKIAKHGEEKALLARVGLRPDVWDRRPSTLSGGELKRIVALQAVVAYPRLIIADEPTAFLDISSARTIVRMLCAIAAKAECGCILISHDRNLLNEVCSNIIEMNMLDHT